MTFGESAQNLPRLRFPEFWDTEEWEEGRCRDIATVHSGYGFPDRFQGVKQGQYPFYKVSDISRVAERGCTYIREANNHIDIATLNKIRAKTVPSGTVIFAKIGEAIRSNRRAIMTIPAVIDNNTAGLKSKKNLSSDKFIFYLWSNVSLMDYAGGVVPAVSKSALENVRLCYPHDLEEQQKIADCLSSVDELIEAQEQKIHLLRDYKKGLMQQLFPKEGEAVPRLRFPEFEDAEGWKTTILKDQGQFLSSLTGKTAKDFDTGNATYIPYMNVFSNEFINMTDLRPVNVTDCESQSVVVKGDVFFTISSETPDEAGMSSVLLEDLGNCYLNSFCVLFRFDEGKSPDSVFLGYLLRSASVREHLSRGAQGTTRYNISRATFRKLPILAPSLTEQKKIADCLSSVDELIEKQGQKLDALRDYKKGLMQQLFPVH